MLCHAASLPQACLTDFMMVWNLLKRVKTGCGRALCTVDLGAVDEIVSSEEFLFGKGGGRASAAFPDWVKLPKLANPEKLVVVALDTAGMVSATSDQVQEAGIDQEECDAIAAWLNFGMPRSHISKVKEYGLVCVVFREPNWWSMAVVVQATRLPVAIVPIKTHAARALYLFLERNYWPPSGEPMTHAEVCDDWELRRAYITNGVAPALTMRRSR